MFRDRSDSCATIYAWCNILPRKCIFCHSGKFLKNSRTREKLSNCMKIRADITVRKVSKERNDIVPLAIPADELIAKAACYHWSCYREYTRKKPLKPNGKVPQDETNEDKNYVELRRSLNNLVENPDVVEFTKFKSMIHTRSGKKNLRRKIEQSTNDFNFVKVGKELLIYPNSLKRKISYAFTMTHWRSLNSLKRWTLMRRWS